MPEIPPHLRPTRAHARVAYNYLQTHPKATAGDFVNHIVEKHTAMAESCHVMQLLWAWADAKKDQSPRSVTS